MTTEKQVSISKKIRVGILFGGKSAEHEISILSAQNIVEALDTEKFDLTFIHIDKTGQWFLSSSAPSSLQKPLSDKTEGRTNNRQIPLKIAMGKGRQAISTDCDQPESVVLDVVFPVLHGPMGEDGTVQGLLKLAGLPFVGSDVLGSAVGMDKDVMKRLLQQAGLPVLPWICLNRRGNEGHGKYSDILEELGPRVFIKPANMGSSIGVNQAENSGQLKDGIEEAFLFDHKVIIEKGEKVREIEVAILDGNPPRASTVGEIVPKQEFYSYQAKYIDQDGAELLIPARLSEGQIQEVQELAFRSFEVLEAKGLARVDFFLTPDGRFWINEINTMPGFTKISMYPSLWMASGLTYRELIEKLLFIAIEKSDKDGSLLVEYQKDIKARQ
ncbi:MAG: D-alanine--D-alanine ligase [Bdellovibrionales bacterium]|nr:D-alanine--D-alanine ligase [Bdellovibrionales bacterium]